MRREINKSVRKIKFVLICLFDGETEILKEALAKNGIDLTREDIEIVTLGMGKARSAVSLTLLLSDETLDLSDAKFIVAGCAGGPKSRVRLGDVVISKYLIDVDLGYHFDNEKLFMRYHSFDEDAFVELNQNLIEETLEIAKKYDQEFGTTVGVGLTGDRFWHGEEAFKRAEFVVSTYKDMMINGEEDYKATQMEDNALAMVLRRFHLKENLLVLRYIVNYDTSNDNNPSNTDNEVFQKAGYACGKLISELINSLE